MKFSGYYFHVNTNIQGGSLCISVPLKFILNTTLTFLIVMSEKYKTKRLFFKWKVFYALRKSCPEKACKIQKKTSAPDPSVNRVSGIEQRWKKGSPAQVLSYAFCSSF